MDEFNAGWVDMSGTKFNSLMVYEENLGENIVYSCRYDIDVKFKNVSCGDRYLDSIMNKNVLHSKETITRTFEKERDTKIYDLDETGRPKWLTSKGIITKSDIEEGTVEDAIDYFLSTSKTETKLQFVSNLFGVDIPKEVYREVVQKGRYEFSSKRKVKTLEYNYTKMKIEKVTVIYEDGESFTVILPNPVTSREVGAIIPGKTLVSLYHDMDEWLKEDYSATVKLLDEVFGFDIETLKGAEII